MGRESYALHNSKPPASLYPAEPESSLCVLIPRRMEPELLRQFVSKATRPKLPGGLLLSAGLSPRGLEGVAETQHDRITRATALHNLLNLLFYKLLDGLRCLKATVVALIQDYR